MSDCSEGYKLANKKLRDLGDLHILYQDNPAGSAQSAVVEKDDPSTI